LRQKNIRLTPHATTLLTLIIESIEDDAAGVVTVNTSLRDAQSRAIEKIPRSLDTVSKAYSRKEINALMLLTLMPRLLSEFCPPFKPPPD
jgi:hypothetical protein